MSSVNIATELVSLVVTVILLFCTLTDSYRNQPAYKIFIGMLSLNIFLLIEDILAWHFEGTHGCDVFLNINASIGYIIGNIISCLLSHYIVASINDEKKSTGAFIYFVDAVCIFSNVLVIISYFNKMYYSYNDGVYSRGDLYWISQAIPIFTLLANEYVVLKHNKQLGLRYTISLMSYGIMPIGAMLTQYRFLDLEITYVASTLSLLMMHVIINTEQSRILQQKEAELKNAKIDIMLSQIQPHFLYNSLGSIRELCNQNPLEAENAIVDFAEYLRGNISSLKSSSAVMFEKELSHIEKYLKLEKMRFGDKLNVCYDIKIKNFMLPPLTIQPLVENAVKYGVGRKKGGGTITLKTHETKENYVITISDDGVGYNPYETQYDGRSHIGIDNVKYRLLIQQGATLEISGHEGVGTVATVNLPKVYKKT